ncbi:MAG: hypothetical protein R3F11_09680 [Verrucomicrobiales bacterium]
MRRAQFPQEVVSRLLVEALDADAGHPNSILLARMPPDGRQLFCPPRPSAYRVRCPAAFVSLPVPRLEFPGELMPGIDALGLRTDSAAVVAPRWAWLFQKCGEAGRALGSFRAHRTKARTLSAGPSLELHFLTGDRVGEGEAPGMEHEAAGLRLLPRGAGVDLIAEDRAAEAFHVDADLVGA